MGVLKAKVGTEWVEVLGTAGISTPDADIRYVRTTGDSMTGFLSLHADPASPSHAARRNFVEDQISELSGLVDSLYVNKSGETGMTGNYKTTGYFYAEAAVASDLHVRSGATNPYADTNTGAIMYFAGTMESSTDNASSTANLRLRRLGSAAGAVGEPLIRFHRTSDNDILGTIAVASASSVNYDTTSDYRLKNDLGPVTDGIERVMQLRPRRITWKKSPELGEFDVFIAHEVADVVPGAVTGEKDAVAGPPQSADDPPEGSIIPQALDYSKLVTVLTAAVQELVTTVDDLTARVAALEG